MSLRNDPHVGMGRDDDRPRTDPTIKDLCGECVEIVGDVWAGKEGPQRVEVRKVPRHIPPDAT
jgi:hypothetical protein